MNSERVPLQSKSLERKDNKNDGIFKPIGIIFLTQFFILFSFFYCYSLVDFIFISRDNRNFGLKLLFGIYYLGFIVICFIGIIGVLQKNKTKVYIFYYFFCMLDMIMVILQALLIPNSIFSFQKSFAYNICINTITQNSGYRNTSLLDIHGSAISIEDHCSEEEVIIFYRGIIAHVFFVLLLFLKMSAVSKFHDYTKNANFRN